MTVTTSNLTYYCNGIQTRETMAGDGGGNVPLIKEIRKV
jgi:hypothetical protein